MVNLKSFKSLREFTGYNDITILCHNYPDADTIASGFALYSYFKANSKANLRLIYGGTSKITKTNLKLLVNLLEIPIEHETEPFKVKGLLITVDCQYSSGNVLNLNAQDVLILDHHRMCQELKTLEENSSSNIYASIRDNLGSCSSLVYHYLIKDNFKPNIKVSTALYYGLYMDTYDFSEIREVIDMNMRDNLSIDSSLFTLLRNSNVTKDELILAGNALSKVNVHKSFAYIQSEECDPNILGLIADMLIMVEKVSVAVVFSKLSTPLLTHNASFKFSVRTCVNEIGAHDFAEKMVSPIIDGETIGFGGGHKHKAGGTIDAECFEKWCKANNKKNDFGEYLKECFDEYPTPCDYWSIDSFIIDKNTGDVSIKKS